MRLSGLKVRGKISEELFSEKEDLFSRDESILSWEDNLSHLEVGLSPLELRFHLQGKHRPLVELSEIIYSFMNNQELIGRCFPSQNHFRGTFQEALMEALRLYLVCLGIRPVIAYPYQLHQQVKESIVEICHRYNFIVDFIGREDSLKEGELFCGNDISRQMIKQKDLIETMGSNLYWGRILGLSEPQGFGLTEKMTMTINVEIKMMFQTAIVFEYSSGRKDTISHFSKTYSDCLHLLGDVFLVHMTINQHNNSQTIDSRRSSG